MSTGTTHPTAPPATTDSLRGWWSSPSFLWLYGAASFGSLKPLADDRMVMRLEPIIFCDYWLLLWMFAGTAERKRLWVEINRQTQRAEAAQSAKEQALQENEAMEEEIRNVRATFSSEIAAGTTASGAGAFAPRGISPRGGLAPAISAAVRILDS